MKKIIPILLVTLFFSSCKNNTVDDNEFKFENAHWRGVLEIPEGDLPFDFYTVVSDTTKSIKIRNGSENLVINDVRVTEDSLIFPGHIFDSEIRVEFINDSMMQGEYVRLDTKEPYSIPFTALKGYHKRFFDNPKAALFDFSGKWEVNFMKDEDTSYALGVFSQSNNDISGTFLTATGDYRFLNGQVDGNTMYLSTFDGSHAFLFKAKVSDNGELKGGFWSGKHWQEKWTAVRNDTYELPNPDTITHFKEGQDEFQFSYINEDKETVTRNRKSFLGKVTIVQILGTWCPNCMDETNFLVQLDGKFNNVEIIGLAFEKAKERRFINKRLERVKTKLNVKYPILYMGAANKDFASEAFPMLNKIISFPTTIVIDKKGNVRKIHTGFNGPGTGQVYHRFTEEFTSLIYDLNNE